MNINKLAKALEELLSEHGATLSATPEITLSSPQFAPKTIKVNGFEVAAPETKELADGTKFYIPDLSDVNFVNECYWTGCPFDCISLKRNLIHIPEENAVAHAKAMLGIDPKGKE